MGVGLPRVCEIWAEGILTTVLNLTLPVQDAGKKVEDMSYHIAKLVANVSYILLQATDGTATFVESQKTYPNTFMQRATPKSNAASNFKLDSVDVFAMTKTLADEWQLSAYVFELLIAAVMIALRAITQPFTQDHWDMFITVLWILQKRRESNAGIHLGTQLLAKQPGRDLTYAIFWKML